jgi:hypothetical protein
MVIDPQGQWSVMAALLFYLVMLSSPKPMWVRSGMTLASFSFKVLFGQLSPYIICQPFEDSSGKK